MMIGQAAPQIVLAIVCPAMQLQVLYMMSPVSTYGTSSRSACPATGSLIVLWRADSRESALSIASGPETTQPGIPRRVTSRAVTVEGIFSDTVSTADKTATFGVSIPSACATGSVFSTIPICVSTSGLMLIAASVIRTIRPSYWKKPHWLSSRRPVCGIRPVSRFKIARAKSAVCSSPFISMSARPSRTVRTASFAASCSVPVNGTIS